MGCASWRGCPSGRFSSAPAKCFTISICLLTPIAQMTDRTSSAPARFANKMQIKKFLARYGRYRTTGDLFHHRQLGQRLAEIGFRVMTIERLATHPVWQIRLKGNLTAQANLLLGQASSDRFDPQSRYWMERQLKRRIQKILNTLGNPIRSDEIVVVRSGAYFQVAFVWPKGTPGVLGRSTE